MNLGGENYDLAGITVGCHEQQAGAPYASPVTAFEMCEEHDGAGPRAGGFREISR